MASLALGRTVAKRTPSSAVKKVVKHVPQEIKSSPTTLRVFAAISDPRNAKVFSVEAALEEFKHIDIDE